MHLLVALLLLAEDELLLRVQQALSGLALARHHQLGCEMPSRRLVGGSTFRSDEGLAIDNALPKCLFGVSFDSAHSGCL